MSNKNYIYQLWEQRTGFYSNQKPQLVGVYETLMEASEEMRLRDIRQNADCQWDEPDYVYGIKKVNRYKIKKQED